MSAVEAAAASFHQHQASGDDHANYEAADQSFRDALPEADFVRISSAIRAAGDCAAPTRDPMNYRSTASTSGNFVMVVYNRTCPGGPLSEQFTFKIVGGQPKLSGYYVAGMALFPGASGQPALQQPQSNEPSKPGAEQPQQPPQPQKPGAEEGTPI
jgi:hypothetical protein